jgi:hypothetical protein
MAVREHEDQCSSTEDDQKFCPEFMELTHPRQEGDKQYGKQQQPPCCTKSEFAFRTVKISFISLVIQCLSGI